MLWGRRCALQGKAAALDGYVGSRLLQIVSPYALGMICASRSASQVSTHVWFSGVAPSACTATGGTYAFDICRDRYSVVRSGPCYGSAPSYRSSFLLLITVCLCVQSVQRNSLVAVDASKVTQH